MKNCILFLGLALCIGLPKLQAQDVLFSDDELTITQYNYTNKKAYSEEYLEYTTPDGYVTTDLYNSKETRMYTYNRDMERVDSDISEGGQMIPKGFIPREYFIVNDQQYLLATIAHRDTKRSEYHIFKKNLATQIYEAFIDPVSVLEGENEYFSQILETVPRVSVSADESKILVAHMMKHKNGSPVFRMITLDATFRVEESADVSFNQSGVFYVYGLTWKGANQRVRDVDIFHITNTGAIYTVGKSGGATIFQPFQLCEIRGEKYRIITPEVDSAVKTIVHGLVSAEGTDNTYLTGLCDMGGRKWSPFIIKLDGSDRLEPILMEFDNQIMGEAMNFPQKKIDKIEAAGKNVSMFPPHAKFLSEEENGDIFIILEIDYYVAEKDHALGAIIARIDAQGKVLSASAIRKFQVGQKFWQGMEYFGSEDKVIVFYNDHLYNAENEFAGETMKHFEGVPSGVVKAAVVKATISKRDASILSQEMIWSSKEDERLPLPTNSGIIHEWYDGKFIRIMHYKSEASTLVYDFH